MDNKDYPTPPSITAAIKALVSYHPERYHGMALELDPATGTPDALNNRVRQVKGQMVPIGMAIAMEEIVQRHDFTEAICAMAGGVFVKAPSVDVDNEDIGVKFNELVCKIGELAQRWKESTEDGVIDVWEKELLNKTGYELRKLVLEYLAISFQVYCK